MCFDVWKDVIQTVIFAIYEKSNIFIMHPAQASEARLGGVHFIVLHIQICTRLLQGEMFKVTMYTAHISSN